MSEQPNDALAGAINLLCAAAIYEGETRETVERSVQEALERAPTDNAEINEEFPTYAEAVAPHMTDAIAEVRKRSGGKGELRGEEK